MRRYKLTVTTASDGTVTAYTPRTSGKLHSVHYVPDGTVPYTNTVDIAITAEATGESLVSRSNVSGAFVAYPRAPTSAADGTASLYAASGTAIQDRIALASDRVKIVLAQGGAAKVGVFHVLID